MAVLVVDGRNGIALPGGSGGGGAVSSVNTATGAVVVDFNSALTHGSTYTGAVEDGHTLTFTRTTLNPAGTDLWENVVNGQRSGYANEGGELRSRAAATGRVAFRCQSIAADNGTAQHIFEVALSDNTVEFSTNALGDSATTRDLTVGRNLIVTAPGTITGGYTTPADIASLGTNVTMGTPSAQVCNGPGPGSGYTFLSGQLDIGGAGVTAGTTIATIQAGSRPVATVIFTLRFTGTGAAAALITITTAGVLTCSANLVSTDVFNLDGFLYQHA